MGKSFFASVLVTFGLFGSLAVACGGGDGGGGASAGSSSAACKGPSNTGNSSPRCTSCIESHCSGQFSAFCSGNCADDGSSSACQKATRDISSCVVDNCLADCDKSGSAAGGSGSGVGAGGSGSDPTPVGGSDTGAGGASFGTPTTSHCKELASCCETLPFKEVQDPCFQAAGYDNDAPCLNLLNSYRNAGECVAGGTGKTGSVACYLEADGTCTKTPVPDSVKATVVQSCTDAGGVASDNCPTADLIGCCTLAASTESCAYPAAQGGLDQAACEQSGGTWSKTP